MKVKEQKEHIRGLIAETITLLCKSGLEYKANFSIEALIGITLDDSDVLLVNINETVLGKNDSAAKHPGPLLLDNGQGKESGELADENRQAAKRNRKRKRKNSDPTKLTPHVTPAKQSKSKEFVPETASDDDDGPRDDPLSGPSVHMERDEHEIGIVLVKEELIGNSFREDTENDTLYQSAFPPADNGSGSFLNESLPSMPVDPESMGGLAIWSTEGASQMNSSTPGGSQTMHVRDANTPKARGPAELSPLREFIKIDSVNVLDGPRENLLVEKRAQKETSAEQQINKGENDPSSLEKSRSVVGGDSKHKKSKWHKDAKDPRQVFSKSKEARRGGGAFDVWKKPGKESDRSRRNTERLSGSQEVGTVRCKRADCQITPRAPAALGGENQSQAGKSEAGNARTIGNRSYDAAFSTGAGCETISFVTSTGELVGADKGFSLVCDPLSGIWKVSQARGEMESQRIGTKATESSDRPTDLPVAVPGDEYLVRARSGSRSPSSGLSELSPKVKIPGASKQSTGSSQESSGAAKTASTKAALGVDGSVSEKESKDATSSSPAGGDRRLTRATAKWRGDRAGISERLEPLTKTRRKRSVQRVGSNKSVVPTFAAPEAAIRPMSNKSESRVVPICSRKDTKAKQVSLVGEKPAKNRPEVVSKGTEMAISESNVAALNQAKKTSTPKKQFSLTYDTTCGVWKVNKLLETQIPDEKSTCVASAEADIPGSHSQIGVPGAKQAHTSGMPEGSVMGRDSEETNVPVCSRSQGSGDGSSGAPHGPAEVPRATGESSKAAKETRALTKQTEGENVATGTPDAVHASGAVRAQDGAPQACSAAAARTNGTSKIPQRSSRDISVRKPISILPRPLQVNLTKEQIERLLCQVARNPSRTVPSSSKEGGPKKRPNKKVAKTKVVSAMPVTSSPVTLTTRPVPAMTLVSPPTSVAALRISPSVMQVPAVSLLSSAKSPKRRRSSGGKVVHVSEKEKPHTDRNSSRVSGGSVSREKEAEITDCHPPEKSRGQETEITDCHPPGKSREQETEITGCHPPRKSKQQETEITDCHPPRKNEQEIEITDCHPPGKSREQETEITDYHPPRKSKQQETSPPKPMAELVESAVKKELDLESGDRVIGTIIIAPKEEPKSE